MYLGQGVVAGQRDLSCPALKHSSATPMQPTAHIPSLAPPCMQPTAYILALVPPCMQVFASVPTCIDLLEGPYIETHEEVVKAFRPASLIRKQKP
jgi:hypothetical protein